MNAIYWKRSLLVLINVVVFYFLLRYLRGNWRSFLDLRNINFIYFLSISIVQIVFILQNTLFNGLLLRRFNLNLSFSELFDLQVVGNLLNKILPRGGSVYRSVYLKKIHKFSYTNFLATIAGTYIVSFLATTIFFVAFLAWIQVFLKVDVFNLLLLFIVFFLLLLPLFFVPLNFIYLKRFFEGWKIISKDFKFVILLIFFSFVGIMLSFLQFFLVLKAIGLEAALYQIVIISGVVFITTIVNFTPDGLGLREAGLLLFGGSIGLSMEEILLASFMQRIIVFPIMLLTGGFSYFRLVRRRYRQLKPSVIE